MEHDLQTAIVSYLKLKHVFCFETDVMSGLQYFNHKDPRRYAFINHHKAMGYIPGQPDMILLLNNGKTVFVELKQKGCYQRKEQRNVQKEIESLGHTYFVWKSLDDAINFIGEQNA